MLNQKGFTLIEMIAVLIILGIVGTIAAVKITSFDSHASNKVVDIAIEELNTREKLVWSNGKLAGVIDIKKYVRENIDWDIGNGTSVSETSITVNGETVPVNRTEPTRVEPGYWERRDGV